MLNTQQLHVFIPLFLLSTNLFFFLHSFSDKIPKQAKIKAWRGGNSPSTTCSSKGGDNSPRKDLEEEHDKRKERRWRSFAASNRKAYAHNQLNGGNLQGVEQRQLEEANVMSLQEFFPPLGKDINLEEKKQVGHKEYFATRYPETDANRR